MTDALLTEMSAALLTLPLEPVFPTQHAEEFYRLPKVEQDEIAITLAAFQRIDRLNKLRVSVNRSAKRISLKLNRDGASPDNLRRWHAHWVKHGRDWRELINRRKVKTAADWEIELKDDVERQRFIEFVGGFIQANQRKNAPGIRAFYRHWRAGKRVPGYNTWRDYWSERGHSYLQTCPDDLPPGWSEGNLLRLCKPSKVELDLVRQGTATALQILPPIPGTREGLLPLQFVTFDDMWDDRKICVAGYSIPARLMMLAARDIATAMFLRHGLRPALPTDEDASRRDGLRASDMKLLVAVLLMDFGWPKEYVAHFILERGTATLLKAVAQALYELSSGHVVCCYNSMQGGLVLGWDERATGNPRSKAGHESDHNLFHNEAANLPGQVGKDRDHAPAREPMQQREALALHRIGQVLQPDQRAALKMPYSDIQEAFQQTGEILARMNDRTKHDLEAFRRTVRWRLHGTVEWRAEEELALWLTQIGKTADEIEHLVEYDPNPPKESPAQRWRRLSAGIEFVKAPGYVVQRLLDEHRLVRVERGSITFKYDGRDNTYWPERIEEALPDHDDVRKKYLAWFVPQQMDWIILTEEHLGYLGTWRRVKIPRFSPDQLSDAIRRKASLLKQAIAKVTKRDIAAGGEMMQRNEALDTNLRIVSDAGLIDEKKLLTTDQFSAQRGGPTVPDQPVETERTVEGSDGGASVSSLEIAAVNARSESQVDSGASGNGPGSRNFPIASAVTQVRQQIEATERQKKLHHREAREREAARRKRTTKQLGEKYGI